MQIDYLLFLWQNESVSTMLGDDKNIEGGEIKSSYKYKHLTLDERITIQKELKEGKIFVEIGKHIVIS